MHALWQRLLEKRNHRQPPCLIVRTRIQVNSLGSAAIAIIAGPAFFQNPRAGSGIARSTGKMIQDTEALSSEEKDCLQESVNSKDILGIIKNHNGKLGGLMAILGDIQSEYGYLPEQALRMAADEIGCSLVDLYGVATFYHSFRLEPQGKHRVCICLGTACHVRGAATIVEEFERQLGIRVGQTTSDGEFTLETVNCLGACAIGPIVTVDGHYFSKVDITKVKSILEKVPTLEKVPVLKKVSAGLLEDEEAMAAVSGVTI